MTERAVTMTLTVADGRGGVGVDTVTLVVTDTTGPLLNGIPAGTITVGATNRDGATLTLGEISAEDLVDGSRPVECAPLLDSVFPIGNTTVNCTSSDSRGNVSTASFRVTVNAPHDPDDPDAPEDDVTPGKVYGYGHLDDDDTRFDFAFSAIEKASGYDRGEFWLRATSGYCRRHRHSHRRADGFVSKAVDGVTFDGLVVVFSGTGRWNGHAGYRFEVAATDKRYGRRSRDYVRITITSATGEVVARSEGTLDGGNIFVWKLSH
jgi:hypothetical protein